MSSWRPTAGDVRLARVGGNARLQMGRSDLIRALDVKGKIDVEGRGSDIELENIAGQVTINGGYTGTLEFKNLAKPLQFEGARSTELSVQAVPGSISMDMGEFTARDIVGPVRLVSQSRDIRIEQFTQSLDLETQRGDIELQPGRLPLSSIEAHSGAGRIDLVLPEKAAFQLQATAERGEAVNDYGPQIQKEVEGRTATLTGKVGDGPHHPPHRQSRLGFRAQGGDAAQHARARRASEASQGAQGPQRDRNRDVMPGAGGP